MFAVPNQQSVITSKTESSKRNAKTELFLTGMSLNVASKCSNDCITSHRHLWPSDVSRSLSKSYVLVCKLCLLKLKMLKIKSSNSLSYGCCSRFIKSNLRFSPRLNNRVQRLGRYCRTSSPELERIVKTFY